MTGIPQVETDVCIIGSGVAGAIVARRCLDSGREVVMLEAGPRKNGRALGLRVLEMAMGDYRIPRMRLWHRDVQYARADNLAADYQVRGRQLVVRGGTTLGWTGDAYRLMPEDFECRSRTGNGIDWPIGYEQLEPHYCSAEEALRVAGDPSDPGHPPRSGGFPATPAPFHERDEPFLTRFVDEERGPMHHNVALARDGSVFVGDELIDELEKLPNFRLYSSMAAEQIECRSAERASAVWCRNTTSDSNFRVVAETIIVCGGGIESPNLLFQSRNKWWPDGLGNHSGHLGRHLTTHGGVAVGGRPRGLRHRDGPIIATAATRRYDTPSEQANGKYLLIWRPAPSGLVFFNAIFEQFSNPENTIRPTRAKTRFGTRRAQIVFDAGDRFRARRAELVERFEGWLQAEGINVANRRKYMLAHHMCTTRMSHTAADGVVDADLKVHTMANLYVCGGGSMASAGAANPTVTVAALADRLGRRLAANAPDNREDVTT